jgi:hypothetical protein
MAVEFPLLVPLNMNKNEIYNLVAQLLSSNPGSPVEAQVYYNSSTKAIRFYNGTTWVELGTGSGSVTSVSVVSSNGFAGTVATATSTPAITLTTTVTGLLKGNGTSISAASAGTDYLAPNGDGSALTGITVSQVSGAAPLASPTLTGTPLAPTATAGTNTTQIATTAFVNTAISAVAQGLDPKPGARVATTAALPTCTYANGTSGVGATLTGNSNGALTVDSYAVAAGDIVLVKNQAAGLQNGLYDVTQAGSGGTPFILTRNTSMDTTGEFSAAYIVVEDAGTTNANSFWVCTNSVDPTVGTTAITFSQLNGATQLIAGTGVTISGNTVSLTSGVCTPGTYDAVTVDTYGRVTAGTSLTGTNTKKYTALIGDGASTSISIAQATHGLVAETVSSKYLIESSIYDASTGQRVYCDIVLNFTTGAVTFNFATAPASNAYRVILIG